MVNKYIFLDIDGPMIPGTKFLFDPYCSIEQNFSQTCVDVLKLILEKSGAKIVFNTSHNVEFMFGGLVEKFKEYGLDPWIHPVSRTTYPHNSTLGVEDPRLRAIEKWLSENRENEQDLWIAFDDCPMPHKRACHVDFNHGLGLAEYRFASKYLMFKDFVVL